MSQSSIDFTLNKMINLCEEYDSGKISYSDFLFAITEIQEQSKEMHKEEIEDAYDKGSYDEYEYHINNEPRKNSEIYYNETFNK